MEPMIKFIRLTNNEDIVAAVTHNPEDDTYTLTKPLKLFYSLGKGGQIHVSFLPWVFSSIVTEHEYVVMASNILTMANTSKTLEKHYMETSNNLGKLADFIAEKEEEGEDITTVVDEDGNITASGDDHTWVKDFLINGRSKGKKKLN